MYVVYILKSVKDNTYYIGYTKDLDERLRVHNLGKVTYTKPHRPYVIARHEFYATKAEAEQRERELKAKKNTKRFLETTGSPASACLQSYKLNS